MIIYKFNVRVLNFTMIIDNELLKQLFDSSKLSLDYEKDQNNNSNFLHKLESVVHLFKVLDETTDIDNDIKIKETQLREDEVNYDSLISYLEGTAQFNNDVDMFEVPKVIETE